MESSTSKQLKPSINITTYGVETSRYNSLLKLDLQNEEYALHCCGNRLILRKMGQDYVLIDQKVIDDAIMVIAQCQISGNILVSTYDAHFKVFKIDIDQKSFIELIDVQMVRENNEYRYVRHAQLRDNRIIFCSEIGKEQSKLVVIEYSDKEEKIVFEKLGGYRFCEFNKSGDIYAVRKIQIDEQEDILQYHSEILNQNTFEIQSECPIIQFKKIKLLQLINNYKSDTVIMCFNNKQIGVQNLSNLAMLRVINFLNLGSSPASPASVEHYYFMIVQAKLLMRIDIDKLMNKTLETLEIDIKNLQPNSYLDEGIELIQTKHFFKKDCYSMIMSNDFSKLLMCCVNEVTQITSTESGASLLDVERQSFNEQSQKNFSITCSGSSISKTGDLIAVGDFVGSVHIYSSKTSQQINICQLEEQVRYLHFHDYHNSILIIATFSGAIYIWSNVDRPGTTPKRVLNLFRTVTSIRTSHGQVRINPIRFDSRQYLIFGTIRGQLSLYSHDEYLPNEELDVKDLTLEWSIIAHEPSDGPFDENFGSLQKQSEIWSIIPNKGNLQRLVTASEDQLCKVWQIQPNRNPILLASLSGHKKAVTSVDWQKMRDGKDYLVSCSDDKFVRIYSTESDKYELIYDIHTQFINDWHTLTYLCMEENGDHIAVVSENGYLFVIDIFERKFVYSRKIHNGSIESLTWRGDTLVCCSSDCTFSQIQFTNHKVIESPKI